MEKDLRSMLKEVIDGAIQPIHHELQGMRVGIGEIKGRLDHLEGRFDQMEGRFDQMEGRFDQMESRLDRVEDRLDRIEETVAEIPLIKQAVLENLEITKNLEKTRQIIIQGQERQDKILESLALRSLEQETELRELKRAK